MKKYRVVIRYAEGEITRGVFNTLREAIDEMAEIANEADGEAYIKEVEVEDD